MLDYVICLYCSGLLTSVISFDFVSCNAMTFNRKGTLSRRQINSYANNVNFPHLDELTLKTSTN